MVQRLICPRGVVPVWFLLAVIVLWALTLVAVVLVSSELYERWSKRGGGRY
jgi:hypothetical protein